MIEEKVKKIKRPNFNIQLVQKPKKVPRWMKDTGISVECPLCAHVVYIKSDDDGARKITCPECGNEYYGW
jgi:hypothetical protein